MGCWRDWRVVFVQAKNVNVKSAVLAVFGDGGF